MVFIHAGSISAVANFHVARKTGQNNVDGGNGSTLIILYYVLLNLLLSPGYPWSIYPIFVVLWWPLSLYHVRKRTYFKFSLYASLLLIVFFITVNAVSSPTVIWAVYPIFCVLWWPLSMYYFYYRRKTIS